MISGHIEGATRVIGKSQGYNGLAVRDDIANCTVNGDGTPEMVTAWFPTDDEIARIHAGAPIYLHILGRAHPPVRMEAGPIPE